MPRGQSPSLTVERVIWKKHRIDVLRALAKAGPDGLPHKTIQYDVVKGSVASTILTELVQLRLVEWRADRYRIADGGRRALEVYDQIGKLNPGSSGNGGAGVR